VGFAIARFAPAFGADLVAGLRAVLARDVRLGLGFGDAFMAMVSPQRVS
jgi:hypothetical protein